MRKSPVVGADRLQGAGVAVAAPAGAASLAELFAIVRGDQPELADDGKVIGLYL